MCNTFFFREKTRKTHRMQKTKCPSFSSGEASRRAEMLFLSVCLSVCPHHWNSAVSPRLFRHLPQKVIVPGTPQATPTCRHKPLLKSDHFLQLLITLCLSFWSPVPQAPDSPLALENPPGCSTGSRWCSLHLASWTSCSLSAHLPEPRWDGEESVILSAHRFALAEAAGRGADVE